MLDFLTEEKGFTLVTKKNCVYSKNAKKFLKKHNIKYIEIEVKQNGLSKETWGYKKIKTAFKQNTFPILINEKGKRIGGLDDIAKFINSSRI